MSEEILQLFWVYKWFSITFKSFFWLAVIQEMTEVNMEKLSRWIVKHEVTWMSVTYSKNIGCNTLTCKRTKKSLVIIFKSILDFWFLWSLRKYWQLCCICHEMVHYRVLAKGSHQKIVVFMHVCDYSSFVYKFNVTCFKPCF